jgi:hypothetical protein
MNSSPTPDQLDARIHGYLDDTLSEEQHAELQHWLADCPGAMRRLVEWSLLHDAMHHAVTAERFSPPSPTLSNPTGSPAARESDRHPDRQRSWPLGSRTALSRPLSWALAACAGALVLSWFWISTTTTRASSAFRDLTRIQERVRRSDCTYEISVERAIESSRRDRQRLPESTRPPKPPLDGAILHVRDQSHFVLVRQSDGRYPFITGCNGTSSWSVRPDGSIKTSRDPDEFQRDLPGHETGIPLNHLEDGLENLKKNYELEFSSLGPEEFDATHAGQYRVLIAIKKPKQRGPQRVEIVYEADTGRIEHMRFVQMPYGPQRLDLRLTQIAESPFEDGFFHPDYQKGLLTSLQNPTNSENTP